MNREILGGMSFNRRDVLKLFGAGATIAPVLNGLADEQRSVRLIESPKVELIEPPRLSMSTTESIQEIILGIQRQEVMEIVLIAKRRDGRGIRARCNAFVSNSYIGEVGALATPDVEICAGFVVTSQWSKIESLT